MGGSDATVIVAAAPAFAYTLVHVVVSESHEELIEAQVLAPMIHQAQAPGRNRPQRVVVALLEPLRVALRRRFYRRVRTLRARYPALSVIALPFMSRLGHRANAR